MIQESLGKKQLDDGKAGHPRSECLWNKFWQKAESIPYFKLKLNYLLHGIIFLSNISFLFQEEKWARDLFWNKYFFSGLLDYNFNWKYIYWVSDSVYQGIMFTFLKYEDGEVKLGLIFANPVPFVSPQKPKWHRIFLHLGLIFIWNQFWNKKRGSLLPLWKIWWRLSYQWFKPSHIIHGYSIDRNGLH